MTWENPVRWTAVLCSGISWAGGDALASRGWSCKTQERRWYSVNHPYILIPDTALKRSSPPPYQTLPIFKEYLPPGVVNIVPIWVLVFIFPPGQGSPQILPSLLIFPNISSFSLSDILTFYLPGLIRLSALSASSFDFSPTAEEGSGVTGRLFKMPFTGVRLHWDC